MFGNTLNYTENESAASCDIQTASSADLFITSDDTILAAYLYWAGSGSVVYHGNNSIDDWNGNYHQKPLPSGTYFYVLNLNDNYFESLKGWIYLLR